MQTTFRRSFAAALLVGMPALAAAQTPAAPRPLDAGELRHQIYVMEGALARAVEFGAQRLNQEIRDAMPGMVVLAGNSQARGFHLEGYGVFFDVEVPVLRQSMMWSLRVMLEQDEAGARQALAQLKEVVGGVTDPAKRASLDRAIKQIELRLAPMAAQRPGGGETVGAALVDPGADSRAAAPAGRTPSLPIDKVWVEDPNRAYTESVQGAIIDAMIDFSAPMRIAADEVLTVAARDNSHRDSLAPQDPYEEIVTVMLTIRGSDLAAYRSGQIDRDEARKRVRVREF